MDMACIAPTAPYKALSALNAVPQEDSITDAAKAEIIREKDLFMMVMF